VARSPYAEVHGVPLAALGLAFAGSVALLLLLGLLAGPEARSAAALLAALALALALAVDVVLFGIQLFAIKAFCRLCLLTYALNALAFVLLLPARRGAAVRPSMRLAAGRAALAGWGAATVAILVAVLAGSAVLRDREKAQQGALLGLPAAPSAAPSLAPAVPGSDAARYQEEARLAQEQARRLQEILDDPKKLDDYLTQKAQREYEQGAVRTFNLKGTPSKGPQEAPIRVVEFSDFLCPYCRQIAGAFAGYLPQSGNRVIVYFKHYPLDQSCNPTLQGTSHPGSCAVALGGVCANDQGKFWEYHDRVFNNPPANPQPRDVVGLAREAGLDAGAFETCLSDSGTLQRLKTDIAEGSQAQVQGTPTLFINGKRLPRLNDFVQTVDREAAKMGLPPLAPPAAASGH
jgi:protein-disulfide isomerase